jgi:iron complex outermembrane recepter protein
MRWGLKWALVAGVACWLPAQSLAQEPADAGAAAPKPAPNAADELPAVEVIQKQPQPAPKTAQKKSAPKKKQAAAPTPQPVAPETAGTGGIDSGTVMMSPVAGSDIPVGKYPGAVGRTSSADIHRTGDPSLPEQLQNTVPGAILGDQQGNVFQRNLQYRGFEASPVNGVAQGIAVYQNGVRINESFGDIVNWDFLPDNAIDGITIVGANPVFGLNAIGGAAVLVMRDGFNFQGAEFDIRAGSFGRLQSSLALGGNSGNWGVFVAVEGIKDDGYRDFSEAEIKRAYADIGVKGDGTEFHLNFTGAKNFVGATVAAPVQLLDLGWNRTFTSPQTTDNEMHMLSLNGSVKATPTLTLSGVTYYRWFNQNHLDANVSEAVSCVDDAATGSIAGKVCLEDNNAMAVSEAGASLDFNNDTTYGTLDRTSQDAGSYGATLQGVEKTPMLGLPNQFLVGASYDRGRVDYASSSALGFYGPRFVATGFPDFVLAEPDDFAPRSLTTQNEYAGVYVSDTLELTSKLALTVGGRYNYARIQLQDNTGNDPEIDGTHTYERFNPMAGATYDLMQGLTLYGGYAEANRAPTPAELACADPENPCLIESFLTADPPLKQVVSRTFELGLRGKLASLGAKQRLDWTVGVFRSENQDDIISLAAPTSGRGYFQNAGDTLRQGVEAGVQYHDQKWSIYANYAYVDATFRSSLVLPSPDHPSDTAIINCDTLAPVVDRDTEPVCVQVQSGDRLPGVPRHRFKAGVDYWVTPRWKVGADLVAASNQIFFGDPGNDAKPLAGYAKVDLRTSYDITEHVQIYGMVDNVFDARYGLFGNFFNTGLGNDVAEADGLGAGFFTDPRTITPAPPVAIYGGLKVRY